MYRILLVDDTPDELACLQFLIHQHGLPLACDTACNGQEALERLRQTRYDILLTDIKMPLMDGIDLSARAKALDPNLQIVLLSGYNEFEYAKAAISIGVTDYLLKPLEPQALLATLTTVMQAVTDRRFSEQEASIVRRHLVNLALDKGIEALAGAHRLLDYGHMMLLELEGDFFSEEGEDFEEALRRELPLAYDFVSLYPVRGLLLFHVGAQGGQEAIRDAEETIRQLLARDYGRPCHIAQAPVPGPADFVAVYQRLESRVERKEALWDRMQHPAEPSADTRAAEALVDKMTESLDQGEMALFIAYFDRLCELQAQQKAFSTIYTRYVLSRLASTLMRQAGLTGGEEETVERIFSASDMAQSAQTVRDLATRLETRESKQMKRSVEDIKQYVYANYGTSLSLGKLSAVFFFSPTYLCHVFKRETGCNLIKFINDHRMEKARELLGTTQTKISAIAVAVGYKSASYFCQRFRDCFGVTPEQYRQQAAR